MQHELTTDEAIMRIILKVYDAMDEQDRATWSLEEAEKVVADQILMDKERSLTPLPYEAEDFYDTICALIALDREEEVITLDH